MSEIHNAMINSLHVLNGSKTIEGLIMEGNGWFVFNPEEPVSLKTLDIMLDYFADLEDYERCQQILTLINDGKTIGKDFRLD
jgi:hypothetical protein